MAITPSLLGRELGNGPRRRGKSLRPLVMGMRTEALQLSTSIELAPAHRAPVTSLALDRVEGRYLLSSAGDGTIALYDVEERGPLCTPRSPSTPLALLNKRTRGNHTLGVTCEDWLPSDTGVFVRQVSQVSQRSSSPRACVTAHTCLPVFTRASSLPIPAEAPTVGSSSGTRTSCQSQSTSTCLAPSIALPCPPRRRHTIWWRLRRVGARAMSAYATPSPAAPPTDCAATARHRSPCAGDRPRSISSHRPVAIRPCVCGTFGRRTRAC